MLLKLNMYKAQNLAIKIAIGVLQVPLAACFNDYWKRHLYVSQYDAHAMMCHSMPPNNPEMDGDDHDGDCNAQDDVTATRFA